MRAPTERHLEDWICENLYRFGEPDEAHEYFPGDDLAHLYHWIDDETFVNPYIDRLVCRQVSFPHGIPDLIGLDSTGECLRVVELKKGPITLEAVAQCARYMYDLRKIIGVESGISPFSDVTDGQWFTMNDIRVASPMVQGMVVGSDLPDRNVMALAKLVDIRLVTYDLQPDGVYTFDSPLITDTLKHREDYCTLPADEHLCIFEALAEIVRGMYNWSLPRE
jgi:hypothetical protein